MSAVDVACMLAAAGCFAVLAVDAARSLGRARQLLRDLDSERVDV